MLVHLPHDYVRTLSASRLPLINNLGYRIWESLLRRKCKPTARAVAQRFEVNKDTAARALKSLLKAGMLWRDRRSAGRGVFAWCYLVTDEPFAWEKDPELLAEFTTLHDAEVERLREFHQAEKLDGLAVSVPPPATAPEEVSAGQDVASSCPTEADIPKKFSRRKIFTPYPQPVDGVIHRPGRLERRLIEIQRLDPRLTPHIPGALALLHGLGFPPLTRTRHCRVVAAALLSGRTMGSLQHFLTAAMGSARSPRGVMAHRLGKLQAQLDSENAPCRAA